MTERIGSILAEEKKTLNELRALTAEVCTMVEFDEEMLSRVLNRRSELILNLGKLVESRKSDDAAEKGVDARQLLTEEIIGLASEIKDVETRASQNLDKILMDLKKQAAGLERDFSIVKGYGMVSAHLSRFADHKG